MSAITEVRIAVEDGTKSAEEYAPPRKVRVELFATVPEGENGLAVVDQIGKIASAKVAELLGRRTATSVVSPEDLALLNASAGSTGNEQQAVNTPPPGRKRRTKAEIDADAKAAAEAANAADPSAIVDPDATAGGDVVLDTLDLSAVGEPSPTTSDASPASSADPASLDEWDVGPDSAPVTDADLNAAVSKKNQEINNADRIRDLIRSFNPDPLKQFQLREIAPAQRADFLAKLDALKK